ncbi:TetR/AcrR family transcriptional regulator [Streptomyces lichenis]|uniref:TetR/AcrR family transcriptional regulator n=1 Tax=Streptomyces lichenis TaxID=2306967 RepID=A0ABT0I8Y0_9ACTN|nr:TetR/AcrR family transcriptional regulator [Streptomyces lichenis]MCK8677772.1 TetR/AcrR family transcriptional regulator [Streptomyces lichenis]
MTRPSARTAGTGSAPRVGTKGVPRAVRERQILDAATEEFGRRGYHAASLTAVADRVGVTKTLLHQYFGAKQDLYLACLTPVGDRVLDAVRAAMADGGGRDPGTPLRVLHALFTALEGRREGWFVLYDPSLPADGEPARRAGRYRAEIDRLAALGTADLLDEDGAVDPLDADALMYAWRGLVTALVRWWVKHPGQSPEQMARRCARLFAVAGAAFAAEPPTGTSAR